MIQQRTGPVRRIVTFRMGSRLVGLPAERVQEILRPVSMTPVPRAPAAVLGAINLRGEVVTVLDLRTILRTPLAEGDGRLLIMDDERERVALRIDKAADMLTIDPERIEPAPANLPDMDATLLEGVVPFPDELLAVLCPETLLAAPVTQYRSISSNSDSQGAVS